MIPINLPTFICNPKIDFNGNMIIATQSDNLWVVIPNIACLPWNRNKVLKIIEKLLETLKLRYEIDVQTYKSGRSYAVYIRDGLSFIFSHEIYSHELEYYYHGFSVLNFYSNEYILVQHTIKRESLSIIELRTKEDAEETAALFTEALKEIRKIEKIYNDMEENLLNCGGLEIEI